MSTPFMDRRQATLTALSVFAAGLMVIVYNNTWWPEISLVIGAAVLCRQYFRGRRYDMWISVLIFGGIYLFYMRSHWMFMFPVAFVLGGIYISFRECFDPIERTGEDAVEDKREEIEDAE